MSSHKEAPGIANDAAADNTDVYAFVSPDKPDTVTLIANFVPLEDPAGGPNFFEFGDDVLYEIHIDNDGDGVAEVTYQFRFTTEIADENTFLYNTGTIATIDSPNWNRKQFYGVTRVAGPGGSPGGVTLGSHLACPPCNIGPASTPNYADLAAAAIHPLTGGVTGQVFAGQRAEGFYVDLGAIFDLGILRPFLSAHLAKMPNAPGVNATAAKNIHTIAIQVPKSELVTGDGSTATAKNNVIGVYASASRQRQTAYGASGKPVPSGDWVQVSRLGNPLVNEVLINIPNKDRFNSQAPAGDKQFLSHFTKPELAGLLPALYPGVFPNLAKYKKDRADIQAIFLTGLPPGLPGLGTFQNLGDGKTLAELLRLNVAVPPTSKPSNLGILGGDLAGFPNGRRVFDDVTTIELRALAGATLPLVDPTYKADAAATAITEGLTSSNTDVTANNTVHYQSTFPYLGTPHSGYSTPSDNRRANDLGAINQPPSGSTIPVGAPQTGVGPAATGSDTTVLAGAALAGLAVVGAAAARSRTAGAASSAASPVSAPSTRPRPRPRVERDGASE